jgi:hypothetical protein
VNDRFEPHNGELTRGHRRTGNQSENDRSEEGTSRFGRLRWQRDRRVGVSRHLEGRGKGREVLYDKEVSTMVSARLPVLRCLRFTSFPSSSSRSNISSSTSLNCRLNGQESRTYRCE